MNVATLNLLLIEDSMEDVELLLAALKDSALRPNISVVSDGEKALDFIYREGDYSDAVSPDLIILDLNLPKKSGHEVLSQLKHDPQYKTIPIVIFSTSSSPFDIESCYKNHSNCYICKPMNYEDFFGVVNEIESFWLNRVQLPGASKGGSS